MNRNVVVCVAIGCSLGLNVAFAGSMGDDFMMSHEIKPFASVEAFPVWINAGSLSYSKTPSTYQKGTSNFTSAGARLGGGFAYPYTSRVDLTMEAGWSYFGHYSNYTKGSSSGSNYSLALNGPDLLVGVSYKVNQYELFLKAGTLFERLGYSFRTTKPLSYTFDGTLYDTNLWVKSNILDFLPEIKVGGLYNVNAHWGVSIAYMHAFGDAPRFNMDSITTATPPQVNLAYDLKGPSLNSLMAGVRYQFAD